jgi:ribosome-binding protein aMBF1 (putative translation factor)
MRCARCGRPTFNVGTLAFDGAQVRLCCACERDERAAVKAEEDLMKGSPGRKARREAYRKATSRRPNKRFRKKK